MVQTTLVSGSVDVSCPECSNSESVSLVPNEMGVFDAGRREIEKERGGITP